MTCILRCSAYFNFQRFLYMYPEGRAPKKQSVRAESQRLYRPIIKRWIYRLSLYIHSYSQSPMNLRNLVLSKREVLKDPNSMTPLRLCSSTQVSNILRYKHLIKLFFKGKEKINTKFKTVPCLWFIEKGVRYGGGETLGQTQLIRGVFID